VTIMQMDEGLDTGPIALQRTVEITPEITGGELAELLSRVGAEAIVEVLSSVATGTLALTEQDSLFATYAPKLSGEDLVISWDRGVEEVRDLVRALAPHVGARTFHPAVEGPVKIWRAKVSEEADVSLEVGHIRAENGQVLVGCGAGVLEVLELQMPGAKRISAQAFLRGNTLNGGFAS
jgi:methionyl-tRNA formyltransferase